MNTLYELEIHSFPNGDGSERYAIGVFRSREEAEDTARRYPARVPGFRDYYCEYTIRESALMTDSGTVHSFLGWNEDEDGNETDLIVSPLYADRRSAEKAMKKAKADTPRREWTLEHRQVGVCDWAEGFVREYPSGRPSPTLAELREELHKRIVLRSMTGIEFEYSDNVQYYYPLNVGQQLFLAAVDDDFQLDGFTVRRLRDIYELGDRKGIYQTIAQKEGLNVFDVPEVNITDWHSVFASLEKLGKHIIVEWEYEPDFFRLGVIEEAAQDHVIFRHYDADGVWQEPAAIDYRQITSVTFGDRYAEVFSRYV